MSLRIPEGYAEFWLQMNTPGDAENMYVSIGLQLAVGATPNVAFVNAVQAALKAALDDHVSSSYSFGPSHLIVGQDGGDLRVEGTNVSANGVDAATAVTPNVALLVRKVTAVGGRRGRGRLYMPGLAEGSVGSDGQIDAANLAAIQSDWNDASANVIALADVTSLALFHETAPFLPTPFTEFAVQRYVATQRRRLRP